MERMRMSEKEKWPKRTLLALAVSGMTLGISGCWLDGSNVRNAGAPDYAAATVYLASNSSGGDTSVRVRDEDLGLLNTYTTGANEGVLVNAAGQLVQAGDLMSTGRLVTACNAENRMTGDASYEITGTNTTFGSPKGIARIASEGLIAVANNGASTVLLMGASAAGDVAPVATVALTANAWDLVYDEASDRLFVAQVDGTVAVFDSFAQDQGVGGADRTFSIVDGDGEASVNLHGIDYDADSDRLVIGDVGLAGSDDDGKLYVVDDASTANGEVTATVTFKGNQTRLGNPVDLQLTGTDVRIAEKANGGGAILVYQDIFSRSGGNVAADLVLDTPAPESLAVVLSVDPAPGVTDILDPSTAYQLLTTSNPAPGSATSGQLFGNESTLAGAPALAFDSGLDSVENVTLDRDGNAYITFDDGTTSNSGIAVIGAIDARDNFDGSRDRIITGANTRLMSPKGIELADDLGLLIVAEQGGAEVLVFSACASGNAAPTVVSTGGVAPWDSDYDPASDTLYVALTDGTVAAYDDFSTDMGDGGPDRIITPAMSGTPFAAPTNLHGIRYVASDDVLIVSDVGSGAANNDGALMTIPAASAADGVTNVGKRVANPGDGSDLTGLGNPVDIAFDGADLYVAEKINGQIQVWRDFLTDASLTGNVAPSDSVAATAPESIVLQPE
ncbi:hypothetical protein [Marinobacter zhejiangensis]|uniref:NHL repeat-containing protein n=1 Tax=Marinobacter zhejiangensis TaxID=488535 RepID=A0A1I4PWF2_9GAMM|nr:hypothetical protein [Marinobacter zhejiangensis]SFM32128.1 hypothetical protein SAMN04487963_2032 [Marinobacter zhejiangensis]